VRAYEVMVILDPSLEERTVEPSLQKYLKIVTADGGTIDSVSVWGRRRLAYEIDKHHEGIYAVMLLTCEPDTVKELDRQLTLNESILRTKVIRPTVPVGAAATAEAGAAEDTDAAADAVADQEPADA
jgi:small subunit ribosomal protein S6